MSNIIIPDFGTGNFASIVRMIEKVGGSAEVLKIPRTIDRHEKIVLAGVGAFDHGMNQLRNNGWEQCLTDAVINKKCYVLGLCLGMQLMCQSSEEGSKDGLGWVKAKVSRFKFDLGSKHKIPHMGWNTLEIKKTSPFFDTRKEGYRFYFTHSYHVVCENSDIVTATSDYGIDFVASFESENILGVQFHPEKSHRYGMELFARFIDLGKK